jgi:putative spermidine/putrescine transport system substrate-binding protein
VGNVHFGVPLQWGPNVLVYDSRALPEPPQDLSVLFELRQLADGRPNSGRIQVEATPLVLADAALYLMNAQPQLGIQDPYRLDARQYAAVLALLRRQKPLVQRYWRDVAEKSDGFSQGGVVAAMSRASELPAIQALQPSLLAVLPAAGASAWLDTQMLATSAAHPNCAHRWLEWSLSRQVQAELARRAGSLPVFREACDRPAAGAVDRCGRDGFEAMDRLYFRRTPGFGCGPRKCVPYSRWTDDYLELVDG